jgi:hypothetical protein
MLDLSCFRCAVQGSESCKCFTPCLVQGKERKTKILNLLYCHVFKYNKQW